MKNRAVLTILAVTALVAATGGFALCSEEEQEQEAARREAALRAGRRALCRVHYYFRRPEDETGPAPGGPLGVRRHFSYESYIDEQRSLLVTGVLLDADGHVLTGDMHFEEKYIDRIEVIGPNGKRYPAHRERLLERSPMVVLKLDALLEDWQPPEFAEQSELVDPKSVRTVGMYALGADWQLYVAELRESYDYERDMTAPRWLFATGRSLGSAMDVWAVVRTGGSLNLLCNGEGQPIGACVSGWRIDRLQKESDWQHERLLNGPALTFTELDSFAEECRGEFGRRIFRCKILYRQETGPEAEALRFVPPVVRRQIAGARMKGEKEWTTWGLAVAPGRMIVPREITREQAGSIERIEVTVGEETYAGEFAGAFEEIGAFLVDLTEGEFPATAVVREAERPERMRLFFTVTPEEKFGRKHLKVRPNRWLLKERGYKDRYYVSPVHSASQGSWIINADLDVLGVYAVQRKEGEELREFGAGSMRRFVYWSDDEEARIFWAGELQSMLEEPVAHFDKQIRFKTEDEAKRIVWLGVEFTALSRELAKQLGVEEATKDGSVGLYVNRVYSGSPADEMGVGVGDILLRLQTRKRPHPVELNPSEADLSFRESFRWDEYVDMRYMQEHGPVTPRWPPRLNYLTSLLQTIGEGEEVTLTYLHEGQEVSEDFTIEPAPRDFTSAEKYRNKAIGITVKDVTYEVRAALRLPEEKQAVVVGKVEPGSPTEVAKIRPFELITAIDGTPVGSADQFEERIEEALERGEPSVRLTVEHLGKSRLADLELAQAEGTEPGEDGE